MDETFCLPYSSSDFVMYVHTLRPRQNDRHFPYDIFKCICLNKNVWISIKISLEFVPKGLINKIPTLVQIMAWRRPGHCLNRCWLVNWCIYALVGLNESMHCILSFIINSYYFANTIYVYACAYVWYGHIKIELVWISLFSKPRFEISVSPWISSGFRTKHQGSGGNGVLYYKHVVKLIDFSDCTCWEPRTVLVIYVTV